MTRTTTIAWTCGLLFVAVGVAGGCGWSNARARGLHLWKEDHVTYRFRNFPFVPSNAVGQCPAPGDCPTEFVEPPFFGYHDTCWRRWPQGWEPCPVEPVAEVEEIKPESSSPESPTPSPSDRPEDASSPPPTPAKEPDSVIVPATPEKAPKTTTSPSQSPKKELPKRKASGVDTPKAETPKTPSPPPKTSSQDAPPKPVSPKKSELPDVPQPSASRVEKRDSSAAPAREPSKPPSRGDVETVPRAPSFFPGASRVQSAPTELVVTPSRKRALRSVPPLRASDPVSVPKVAHRGGTVADGVVLVPSSVPKSQRLRRSLRERMRLKSGSREPLVTRTPAAHGGSSQRHAVATVVSAGVKARPISRPKKLTTDSREDRFSGTQGNEPKLIHQSVPAKPISAITSGKRVPADNVSPVSTRSEAPRPVIIDAEKLRSARQ